MKLEYETPVATVLLVSNEAIICASHDNAYGDDDDFIGIPTIQAP